MKRSFLLTLIACLLCCGSQAQLQQGCIRLDAGFIALNFYDAVQLADGGFVASGLHQDSNNAQSEAGVARFDADGLLQWMKVWSSGSGYNTWPRAVTATADGGYAVAGTLEMPGAQGLFIMKFDASDNVEWTKDYTSSNGAVALSLDGLIQLSDGGFALQAAQVTYAGWNMLRTDAAGEVLWSDWFDPNDADALDVAELPNGDLVFTGWGNADATSGLIVRKDGLTGATEWSHAFGSNPAYNFDPMAVTVGPDSTIVLGGQCSNLNGTGNIESFVMAVSSAGTPLWVSVFNTVDHDFGRDVVVDPSGGYMFCGYMTEPGTSVSRGSFAAKLDNSGQPVWTKQMDVSWGTERFIHASMTADGGALFSGYFGTPSSYPALLVKLDAAGNSCPYCPTTVPTGQWSSLSPITLADGWSQLFGPWATAADHIFTVTDLTASAGFEVCGVTGVEDLQQHIAVSLSPNPFTSSCVLTIDGVALGARARIVLRDMTGRVVHEQGIRDGSNVIERGGLSTGCYTYAITDTDTILEGGTLLVD